MDLVKVVKLLLGDVRTTVLREIEIHLLLRITGNMDENSIVVLCAIVLG